MPALTRPSAMFFTDAVVVEKHDPAASGAQDGAGGRRGRWVAVATVAACVQPMGGGQAFQWGARQVQVDTEVFFAVPVAIDVDYRLRTTDGRVYTEPVPVDEATQARCVWVKCRRQY